MLFFLNKHDVSHRDVPVSDAPEIHTPVEIRDDVMLFSHVAIMSGVSIGDDVVVGCGSVVANDLEAYGIYAGVPARRIGGGI